MPTMKFEHVNILSVAHYDGPHRISSEWMEDQMAEAMERMGIRRNLLVDSSGIIERRWFDPETTFSDAATIAARTAIAQAGIHPSQLGLLINTSVCRDFIEPSTACLVHGKLGLDATCMSFDLGNACLGFMNGMDMAANMIEQGQVDYAIVVNAEGLRYAHQQTMARINDPAATEQTFRENFATLTLGSGAAAMVLVRAELDPNGHRYLGGTNLAATQHNMLCWAQPDRMVTDTKGLLINGVKLAAQTFGRAREIMGWRAEDLDQFIIHQVSKVHTEQFANICGLALDRIYRLYPMHGNIGPAGIPIALSKAVEAGRIHRGDRVALMGIGSGLNCSMAEVVW